MHTLSIKRYIIFLCCCSFFIGCSDAQVSRGDNTTLSIDDSMMFVPIDTSYSFIQYDSSHLILGTDSSYMRRFAEKWYRVLATGEGHVNILHLGASHVQGGTFPHRMRCNFLTPLQAYVSSRGMIFPYSAALKCNNPYDYKVLRSRPLTLTRCVYKEPMERLGLCGIAVTAADEPADIGVILNEQSLDFSTNRVVLLGESHGGVVPFIALVGESGDTTCVHPEETDLALRRYSFNLPDAVDSFHIILPCEIGQSFAVTGIYLDNGLPGISYHSIGVNGATLSDYLVKCPYLTSDLQMIHPDLVIFGIGINDASGSNFDTVVFQRRYRQLVDSIRKVNPECAFVFVTNNDSFRRVHRKYEVNPNAELAREAFLRIGQATGGAVWDQFTVMGGLGSMDKWYASELAQRDRIHFTRKGYTLIGDMLSNAIFESLLQFKPAKIAKPSNSAKKTTDDKHLYKKRKKTQSDNLNNKKEDERPNYISY